MAQPNPPFARNTLVFAPNGYGKSTFGAVLRSLKSGDSGIVMGRQTLGVAATPEIDLHFAAGSRRFRAGAWDTLETKISVFDGNFVADNVHSGDAVDINHRRRLYRVIIGGDGVALAEQETLLANQAREKQGEVTAAERAVAQFVPRGMQFREFQNLEADPQIEAKLVAADRTIESVRQAATIHTHAGLVSLPDPAAPANLGDLLGRALEGIEADAQGQIRHHLDRHEMDRGGQNWIEEGLRHTQHDECPFCGRVGLDALAIVQAYKAIFGQEYRDLQAGVRAAIEAVNVSFGDRAIGEITTRVAQNVATAGFWSQYCEIQLPLLPDNVPDLARSSRTALLALLERKAGNPLQAVATDALIPIENNLTAIRAEIHTYNASVATANAEVQRKKDATARADLRTEEASRTRLQAIKRRHDADVVRAFADFARLEEEKRALEQRKNDVRDQLNAHALAVVGPYETRINYFLDRFNAGFRIMRTGHAFPGGTAASTYQLAINNTAVDLGDATTPVSRASFKNTLSAGDKTTLALAFFLASTEREPDLAERIILFDDPFSSQDSFRRKQTIFEILVLAGRAAQTIVLSHDSQFLKQLWDKFQPADRASVQISYHPASGSKFSSFDLENACRGRAQAELDDLMAYRATGAGNPREIIKKLRIVLETHFRSTYPGAFEPDDNCGAILGKIRAGGDQHPAHECYASLDRINEYTAEYHHGEDARGNAEPALDEAELRGFVDDTLKLANALP